MTLQRDVYEVLEVHPRAHQEVIQAAYRVLAALYHPDRGTAAGGDSRRMAELNAAYARIRTPDLRQLYDREQKLLRRTTPQRQAETAGSAEEDPARRPLDFGRYEGWTIAQIARQDPDYLRWLSRHSSGARFRAGIEAELRRSVQRG
jgi:curved DNA-binding protein CbpA